MRTVPAAIEVTPDRASNGTVASPTSFPLHIVAEFDEVTTQIA
jgi:hypothetical protein